MTSPRTPDFRVTLEGKDLTSSIEPRLQGLTARMRRIPWT